MFQLYQLVLLTRGGKIFNAAPEPDFSKKIYIHPIEVGPHLYTHIIFFFTQNTVLNFSIQSYKIYLSPFATEKNVL